VAVFDFPANPTVGQVYDTGTGAVYTWDGLAWKSSVSAPTGDSEFVLKIGDTMTGPLTLSADPVAPMYAATKQYVDSRALPPSGSVGQALVINTSGIPTWGAPVDGGNF
jgi:hypothetical protein